MVTGVTMAAFSAAYMARATPQDPGPFSPDVKEFVATYLKTGGDKLEGWVQGDKVSQPDEALRRGLAVAVAEAETERADEAARERACRGVRGAKPLG